MFIRFREQTAQRYGDGARECAGKCKDRPRYYARYGVGVYVKGRTFVQGCPMKPLCPLAQPRCRLEVSIIETCRADGKVKQKHIASLGSIFGDSLAARKAFWIECEARLARLANRLGPELDRLRQAIAARIPPLTDANRDAMTAAAWDQLEGFYNSRAKCKADTVIRRLELAEDEKREAAVAEAMALQAKRLHGNADAFNPLNLLLGSTLCDEAMCTNHEERRRQLKDQIDALDPASTQASPPRGAAMDRKRRP